MELKPVENIDPPTYPTCEELVDAKAVLSAHLPRRWRKAKGLAGAIAVVLAANCSGGCGSDGQFSSSQADVDVPQSAYVPAEPSDPMLEQAGDWVRSIFGGQRKIQVGFAGDIVLPTTHANEGDVPGILQDNKK